MEFAKNVFSVHPSRLNSWTLSALLLHQQLWKRFDEIPTSEGPWTRTDLYACILSFAALNSNILLIDRFCRVFFFVVVSRRFGKVGKMTKTRNNYLGEFGITANAWPLLRNILLNPCRRDVSEIGKKESFLPVPIRKENN